MSDPQLVAVWLIVAVATVYVLRRAVRVWVGSKKGGCGGGCGCASAVEATRSDLIPSEQLRVREKM